MRRLVVLALAGALSGSVLVAPPSRAARPATAFVAVDTSSLKISDDSAQVRSD